MLTMEEWKILKSFDKTGRRFIKGDIIYISNKGRIKLNDTILEIGKGLYVNNDGQICIVGVGYNNHTTLYRWIYYNFIGPYIKGGGYNIHHIDGNHLNNAADNLIELSAYRHGKVHAEQYKQLKDTIYNTSKIIKQHISNKDKYINDGVKYFKDRVEQYLNSDEYKRYLESKRNEIELRKKQRSEEAKLRRKLVKEQRKQQKLIEQQKLIDSGTHFRAKDGRIMSYEQIHNMHEGPRDNSYITEEWKQKMKQIQKKLRDEGKCTGKASTDEKERLRIERIKKSLIGNKNASKKHKKN